MSTATSSSSDLHWAWRRRFSWLTVFTTVLLISWGGVVTSIGAGMAFPDWPTSLGSYNLLNPVDEWWAVPAYLAEHGHRLIASLVGMMTVVLAGWTWWSDPRAWMRKLGVAAVVLVVAQGILGGLRVLWVSIDLAAVHACVAQLFFALLVAMTLFTTETWRKSRGVLPAGTKGRWLRRMAYAATGGIYLQIVLGALLRHSGGGVSPGFTAFHVTGAFVVVGLVLSVFVAAEKNFDDIPTVRRAAWSLLGAMGLQFILGLAALLVMLYAEPQSGLSLFSVLLTVGHLVVGALLFGTSIVTTLLVARPSEEGSSAPSVNSTSHEPALAGTES
ncbi:cytochrome aa3 oxidase assembly protein CtaA [Salinibacter sp. 10B]|uniref:COX15/CtaA family protein n=1 Tax=Salinibacter sp. 10B TaxID=1923971 RepID=UPI000CF3CDA3|nr:COX15/CtaA family protein [Salinibacter sp. 10B]PQJ34299.1 cytochrome aa3 oxidase assembly protein CtaA [Salinibacter sp. 10B]